MELCPRGTYGPGEMLESVDECTQCDGGSYCDTPGSDSVSGPCTAGYFCQYGVDTPAPSNNNTGFGGLCYVYGCRQHFFLFWQPSQLLILKPAHNQFGATGVSILDFGH